VACTAIDLFSASAHTVRITDVALFNDIYMVVATEKGMFKIDIGEDRTHIDLNNI